MPVERISGMPVAAAWRMRPRSTSSNEAIFSAGTPSWASSSTAARSKGEENQWIPRATA